MLGLTLPKPTSCLPSLIPSPHSTTIVTCGTTQTASTHAVLLELQATIAVVEDWELGFHLQFPKYSSAQKGPFCDFTLWHLDKCTGLLLDGVCTVIEFGISGLSLISVSGLAAMHTWLIARMETTNEDVS